MTFWHGFFIGAGVYVLGIPPSAYIAGFLQAKVIRNEGMSIDNPPSSDNLKSIWVAALVWPLFFPVRFCIFLPDYGRATYRWWLAWRERRAEARCEQRIADLRVDALSGPIKSATRTRRRKLLLGKK